MKDDHTDEIRLELDNALATCKEAREKILRTESCLTSVYKRILNVDPESTVFDEGSFIDSYHNDARLDTILKRNRILTFKHLYDVAPRDILDFPGMGRRSFYILLQVLKWVNFSVDEWYRTNGESPISLTRYQ